MGFVFVLPESRALSSRAIRCPFMTFASSLSLSAMYARSLAKRGYVCFAINYRLAPKHKSPAQTEDCRDAVRWIRQNGEKYKADPERIGAMGYSAGGHLVSMLAVTGLSKEEDPKSIGTKIVAAVAGGAQTDFRTIRENYRSL